MIKPKIESAFNGQMIKEFYSSYLYLSMATHFESVNLRGFARWMRIQAQEEYGHAMKFYEHLVERGGRPSLQSIEAPPSKWDSPKKVFEDAYQHERKITESINELLELGRSEKDHPAEVFLQWFVTEQVEEEATANDIVQKIQFVGDNSSALIFLDSELGKRSPSKE